MRLYVGCLLSTVLVAACADEEAIVKLDVTPVNVTTPEDTPLSVTLPVVANRQVTASIVSPPRHGTLTTVDTLNYTYTPGLDYSGPDSFEVQFSNGISMVRGMANVTVTPVNDSPVAIPDSFAAGFAEMLSIGQATLLANDTDVDGPALTVTDVIPIDHGSVSISGTNVLFTPQPNYQGPATFSYRVSDGTAVTVGTVTVTIGANNPPVAVADTRATNEDTAVAIPQAALVANDTDGDQQTLVVSSVDNPTHGTVTLGNGTITFTPAADYNGPATFQYSVTDGAAIATATVSVAIAPVNDAPSLTDDTGFFSTEDGVLTLTSAQLIGNDVDVDGDTLSIVAVSNALHGTVSLPATLVGDVIVFTPDADYSGPASFDYTVSDGTSTSTGHVSVTIGAANDAPVATDDSASGAEDANLTLAKSTLLGNDTDIDGDTLTVTTVANPTNGTVIVQGTNIVFTPSANYSGPAGYDYTMSDGTVTDVAHVTLTITPVNDAPSAINDSATTIEDMAVMLSVLLNDLDIDGGALSIDSVTQPANGTATFAGGVVTYTPAPDYSGPDSFMYTASDGAGGMSTATVTITVTPANDAPSAGNDMLTVAEDTSGSIDVRLNDSDLDGNPLTVIGTSIPAHGTVEIIGGIPVYTPALNYFGTDSFQYTVSDGAGGQATGTVAVTVTPVNDAPVAVNNIYSANDEVTILISAANGLLSNDTDAENDPLTVFIVSPASQGTLNLSADGSFTYTPNSCETTDTFTYQAFDGALLSNVATVTIRINHRPEAQGDGTYPATTGQPLVVSAGSGVLANDCDPDGDTLSASLQSGPQNGTLTSFSSSGAFTYVSDAGYCGPDSFTYRASDGQLTDTVTVTISVSGGVTLIAGGPICQSTIGEEDAEFELAEELAEDPDSDSSGTAATAGPRCSCSNNQVISMDPAETAPTPDLTLEQ